MCNIRPWHCTATAVCSTPCKCTPLQAFRVRDNDVTGTQDGKLSAHVIASRRLLRTQRNAQRAASGVQSILRLEGWVNEETVWVR
jgi:hypothetical protein